VHIPWPQPDYWHVLPKAMRIAIHDGLLANDVVGFHADRWRINFLRSARDLLDAECNFVDYVAEHQGRRSLVNVHPISVDPAEFEALAQSEAVLAAERELVRRRPEKLILRVDRTDPSKNIVRGFRAFELYLEAHPDAHGQVGMLALLDPSRQDIPEYSEYVAAIQREARRVNDRFQRDGWLPVDVVVEDDFPGAVAAYKQFDVLFVNAIFDGMNLVSKEAPLVNERDGVVVLSENTGAYEELQDWVVRVNPFDVAGQAEAISRALSMSKTKRHQRLEAIRAHVREHDVAGWIEGQLTDLDRCSGRALLTD
jgi:trehalose 6-phosphate synthase